MPRPVHFEIHASDPERAIAFYQKLFDWKFTRWEGPMPYWVIKTGEGPGIDGGLVPRRGMVAPEAPVIAYVCTIGVTSLDTALDKAVSLGGEVALPKQAIPGVGWLAYAKDPEGNLFGLMQEDPAAA
ncbi:MAG TPA: VOC family protein [Gemmatimonadales bacterium]|nr:VOC family protein [Gemmatimonadales bacterium]